MTLHRVKYLNPAHFSIMLLSIIARHARYKNAAYSAFNLRVLQAVGIVYGTLDSGDSAATSKLFENSELKEIITSWVSAAKLGTRDVPLILL